MQLSPPAQQQTRTSYPCNDVRPIAPQLPRIKRIQVRQAAEEEEEAARHDSDMSVDSYPLELMNVIKWQKIYFFINLDIYEVWMGKFLDILAAPST